jgi:hypothetical protein
MVAGPKEPTGLLIRWMEYYGDQKAFSKIMQNLLGAAYHLSLLRDDNFHSELDPDITSAGILAMARRGRGGIGLGGPGENGDQAVSAGESSYSDVEAFAEGLPLKGRLPLHLAVCISPLYLLIPSVIGKKTFGGRNIVDVSGAPLAVIVDLQFFSERRFLPLGIANPLPSYLSRRQFGRCFSAWRMARCSLKICWASCLSRYLGAELSPAHWRIRLGFLLVGRSLLLPLKLH